MNRFLNALKTNDTFTENAMPTHSTSGSALVDFFGVVGGARKLKSADKISYFSQAFEEDRLIAMKLLFWSRDIRGGAGERQLFRDLIKHLAATQPTILAKNLKFIPEFGRWDDVLVLFGTVLENDALRLIAAGLSSGNGLCAKWMPRKGENANKIRAYLHMSPKSYRKGLVELTNVVEQLMCANRFNEIEYSKLPSLAAARYQKAFNRHDPDGYSVYKKRLSSGEVKISAGAVYPYDVIKSLERGDTEVADAQWKALPDYMEGSEAKQILPVVDTSGSMFIRISSKSTTQAIDVAVSLGLYLSERNRGAFKDHFITFSESPKLQRVTGSNLYNRYNSVKRANWGMNTNLEAVFYLILGKAISNKVAAEDMPDQILILSDMQFDSCITHADNNVMQMIKRNYEQHGYKMPQIVFWWINSKTEQSPIKFRDNGTALVSGFSPSIMKSVLSASLKVEEFSPEKVMLETVNQERYNVITV